MDQQWAALAKTVRARREALGLRQSDLEDRGGPSTGTVRNIEQAARTTYAPRTSRQLERSLGWPQGIVGQILAGANPEEAVTVEPQQSGFPEGGRPAQVARDPWVKLAAAAELARCLSVPDATPVERVALAAVVDMVRELARLVGEG